MSDLVEKLRDPDIGWTGDASCVSAEIAAEGADEIEHLRSQLVKAQAPIEPDLARAINELSDYADDLDATERPAIGEYDVTADIRKVCQALCDRIHVS